MRLLVIGGSGHVGTLVLPYLKERHEIRVYDLSAPRVEGIEYTPGDVRDTQALAAAMVERDALLYMAMGSPSAAGSGGWSHIDAQRANFDVNVTGLYLALKTARDSGVMHAVYTSSMSVYQEIHVRGREPLPYFESEDIPADAHHIYGFTKRLGEQVCENAVIAGKMDVNALRLCLPVSDDEWREKAVAGEPTIRTAASDTANALLAALELRSGYQAFTISGDYEQKLMNLAKAKRMLGWEPRARPEK